MKTEPPCQEPDLEIEHVDNFETDLSTITQKITSLSKIHTTTNSQAPQYAEARCYPKKGEWLLTSNSKNLA